jgi:hypothetical protein
VRASLALSSIGTPRSPRGTQLPQISVGVSVLSRCQAILAKESPMRLASVLVVLAACTSSSSKTVPDAAISTDGGAALDGGSAVTCSTTIASYCASHACSRTLDDAKQNRDLCPAVLTPCSDYDLVKTTSIDTSTTYYYLHAVLVAIQHRAQPMPAACLAGPTAFVPPACGDQSQTLPVCITH